MGRCKLRGWGVVMLAALGAVAVGGLAGCTRAGATDPVAAQEVLRGALEAWKSGQTPEASGLTVGDSRWQEGYALKGYAIEEGSRPAGFDTRFSVRLELTDPKGRVVSERAAYIVGTKHARTVVRTLDLE